MRLLPSISAGLAAAAIVTAAYAGTAEDAAAALKDRHTFMKGMGEAMKGIKGYLDGNADLAKAQQGAAEIAAAAANLPAKFPAGTTTEDFPGKSGAKPIIWSEWDKFLGHQKDLVAESEKLVAATKGGDKAAIAAQFAATGKNGCGGCHNTYRQKL
jgi:cytochrome c556